MVNLDTHILLFAFTGELTPGERRLLSEHQWSISAIVLWELAKLAQLARIDLDIDSNEFSRYLSTVHLWPLTLEICTSIRKLDFKSDPANELICSTSLVHDVPLLTRDRLLRRSKIVPLA